MSGQAKCVLITGCSSGIGQAAAIGIRGLGFRVLATARSVEDVEALKAEGFESIALDLLDPTSVRNAIERVQREGALYGLVNAGWRGLPGAQEDLRDAGWDEQLGFVKGTIKLTIGCLPALRQASGRIVNVSSVLGFSTLPLRGAYCAGKAAWDAHSEALRLEMALLPPEDRIHISVVQPGPINKTAFKRNAALAMQEHVLPSDRYAAAYEKLAKSLDPNRDTPGTLGTEAVVRVIERALTSKTPKSYYPVTRNTRLLSLLERVAGRTRLANVFKRSMF